MWLSLRLGLGFEFVFGVETRIRVGSKVGATICVRVGARVWKRVKIRLGAGVRVRVGLKVWVLVSGQGCRED